ncbi:MAG: hypothetical protein ABW185_28470 [Sedimenticola sp.]
MSRLIWIYTVCKPWHLKRPLGFKWLIYPTKHGQLTIRERGTIPPLSDWLLKRDRAALVGQIQAAEMDDVPCSVELVSRADWKTEVGDLTLIGSGGRIPY